MEKAKGAKDNAKALTYAWGMAVPQVGRKLGRKVGRQRDALVCNERPSQDIA